ncbi:MAG: ABC transporter substrate-binding protein, partial [Acetobacteraceae bacterium]|nr:ABC transporter substrate-binding protein [Acetobacteraceae bacterium]
MVDLTRRILLAGAASAGLAPALLGTDPALAQAAATPKRGGTLNTILTPEPPILVLGINNQGPTQIAASKLFEGLLQYSFKLEPMPQLAKSWSLSDDKKTYTFKLQDNIKFHDGHPMTADDVIFSITRFQSELSPRARPIFANIKEATAPDPQTVVLTLERPF